MSRLRKLATVAAIAAATLAPATSAQAGSTQIAGPYITSSGRHTRVAVIGDANGVATIKLTNHRSRTSTTRYLAGRYRYGVEVEQVCGIPTVVGMWSVTVSDANGTRTAYAWLTCS